MLTVAKISQGAAAGYAEYLDGRTQATAAGDYYLRDGDRVEAPGRWASGNQVFGIDATGAVTGEQLRTLLDIRRPDTAGPLRPVGANGKAVAALDATFSAPKSVSAVWALADADLRGRIEAAHEHAIDRTLDYAVQRVAMIRQRVSREHAIHISPAEVIATSWRHSTARAVPGQPPDPQLHSHVLLHGAVRDDGQVMAIDSRTWLVHRRELGAAYRTELAYELRALGFEIQRGTGRAQRYFEIRGVPAELVERWSHRDRQIRAAIDARLREQQARFNAQAAAGGETGADALRRLEQLGEAGLSPAQNRAITVATRTPKDTAVTDRDLDAVWSTVAAGLGFDRAALQDLRAPRPALQPANENAVERRLTEFDATFPDHAGRAVALEASVGTSIKDGLAVLDRARAAGELLALEGGRSTTRAHRTTEHATQHAIHRLAGARATAVPQALVEQEITRLGQELGHRGDAVTTEQADAIRLACGEGRLTVIEGQAGTGKSTVLGAVARAHQSDGRQIIVTSTAALAAQRLGDDLEAAGVTASVSSTAALHAAVTSGHTELGPDTTVIHDEAALASTREQHRLVTAVQDSGARLIEVGDPEQSQPVGAAGLWPTIESAATTAGSQVELTRNVRARDPDDRRDQKRFRDGDIAHALAGYQGRGHITWTEDPRKSEDGALEAAEADRAAGHQTMVIAQTSNEQLDALNARAQVIHHDSGDHDDDDAIPVPGRPYGLRTGDPVQIRHTIHHPDHPEPIRNGTTAYVTHVNPDPGHLALQAADGRRLELDREQLAAADVRLAYVQHPFPAQGQTTDTTHLIVSEHATREGSYVALTRARDRTHIYASPQQLAESDEVDPLVALTDRMSRTEPDVPSIHYPLAHEDTITATPDMAAHPTGSEHGHELRPGDETPLYLTAALGPRPEPNQARNGPWQAGADAIDAYRTEYEIPDGEPSPLGPCPPAGQFRQRHDRRQAADRITAAARQLGVDPPELEPTAPDAGRDRLTQDPAPDRSGGYEP